MCVLQSARKLEETRIETILDTGMLLDTIVPVLCQTQWTNSKEQLDDMLDMDIDALVLESQKDCFCEHMYVIEIGTPGGPGATSCPCQILQRLLQ